MPAYCPIGGSVWDARVRERRRPQHAGPNLHNTSPAPLPPAGSPSPQQKVSGLPVPAEKHLNRSKSQAEPPWPPGVSFSVVRPPLLPAAPSDPETAFAPERNPPGVAVPGGPGERRSWPQCWGPSWKGRSRNTGSSNSAASGIRHCMIGDEGRAPGLGLSLSRGAPARQPCQENAFFSLPLPLLPRGSFRSLNALRRGGKRKRKKKSLGLFFFPPTPVGLVSARR